MIVCDVIPYPSDATGIIFAGLTSPVPTLYHPTQFSAFPRKDTTAGPKNCWLQGVLGRKIRRASRSTVNLPPVQQRRTVARRPFGWVCGVHTHPLQDVCRPQGVCMYVCLHVWRRDGGEEVGRLASRQKRKLSASLAECAAAVLSQSPFVPPSHTVHDQTRQQARFITQRASQPARLQESYFGLCLPPPPY